MDMLIARDDIIRFVAEHLEAIPNERKADVLCALWGAFTQRESSGPCLPALQTRAGEKAQGRGTAPFYPLLLSLWGTLSAA